MVIGYTKKNIKEIREVCFIVQAECDAINSIPGIYRFIAYEQKDLAFLISRLHLKIL